VEERFRVRSLDEVRGSILGKLEAIERHKEPARLAAGWTKSADGRWIPPGYAWAGPPEDAAPPADPGPEVEDTPRATTPPAIPCDSRATRAIRVARAARLGRPRRATSP
jgi:hypothetical protein